MNRIDEGRHVNGTALNQPGDGIPRGETIRTGGKDLREGKAAKSIRKHRDIGKGSVQGDFDAATRGRHAVRFEDGARDLPGDRVYERERDRPGLSGLQVVVLAHPRREECLGRANVHAPRVNPREVEPAIEAGAGAVGDNVLHPARQRWEVLLHKGGRQQLDIGAEHRLSQRIDDGSRKRRGTRLDAKNPEGRLPITGNRDAGARRVDDLPLVHHLARHRAQGEVREAGASETVGCGRCPSTRIAGRVEEFHGTSGQRLPPSVNHRELGCAETGQSDEHVPDDLAGGHDLDRGVPGPFAVPRCGSYGVRRVRTWDHGNRERSAFRGQNRGSARTHDHARSGQAIGHHYDALDSTQGGRRRNGNCDVPHNVLAKQGGPGDSVAIAGVHLGFDAEVSQRQAREGIVALCVGQADGHDLL